MKSLQFCRKIVTFLDTHRLLERGDSVLVAVSGGPDSVALLHILHQLKDELGLSLEVAHLQHGIRGEAAKQDARFVAGLAARFKLRFHLKEIDLPEIRSAAGKGNLEALARAERYRFLAAVARDYGIKKVATAHTEDDQAETVLMWLLRGCGMTGLGAMAPVRPLQAGDDDIFLIRPLLGLSKTAVLQFIEEHEIEYRMDATNNDTRLLRNWVRSGLMPQLKQRIDPGLPSRLARQAQRIRDENGFLEKIARAELEKIRRRGGIDRKLFLQKDKAIQRRIVRVWLQDAGGDLRGLDADHVESMLRLAAEGMPQSRISIPGGWQWLSEYETLRLEKHPREPDRSPYSHRLNVGEPLHIEAAGMTIRSEYVKPPLPQLPEDLLRAVFDAGVLQGALTVRNFRPGDRFRPLGMNGTKKVKDLFIEKRAPFSVRAALPLLTIGGEILWIPGYGRSEIGRVHSRSASILALRAVRSRVK